MNDVTFTVRELQAHIGQALRAVERGYHVYITSRGKPVAMMGKPRRRVIQESPLRRKLRRLAAEGKVILGTGGPIRDFPCMDLGGIGEQRRKDREARDRVLGLVPRRRRKRRS